jgi:acid stress-induced BolA-like protein IbaG/YrbA
MQANDVRAAILAALPDCQIEAEGEGCNFSLVVVSPSFEGLLPVKRQQKVYAAVQHWLASGELHALSLRTYTPAELERASAANPAGLVSLG